MHHEEIIFQGILYWRDSPHADWVVVRPEQVVSMLIKAREEIKQLKEELAEVRKL